MSSEAIIVRGDNYILYNEAFDDSTVYLQINDCIYNIKVNHYYGEEEEQLTIALPTELWDTIVKDYLERG